MNEEEDIYRRMLKDDKVRCTCDEAFNETDIKQASGHYHSCMLYQIIRAIRLTLKYYGVEYDD